MSRCSDVTDHFLAGRVSSEIPVHQVGHVVLLAVALGEADRHGRGWHASRPSSRMTDRTSSGGRHAPGGEVHVDATVPVRLTGIVE